jgi:hypothetical protein
MSSKNINLDLKNLPQLLAETVQKLARYVPIMFIVLIALVYGFVLLRITMLANAQPKDTDVTSEVSQLTPHIDKNAVQQLQSLEDNSVNVQALFKSQRSNPFGE